MPDEAFWDQQQQREAYAVDLNPNTAAGLNRQGGVQRAENMGDVRTAYDIKDAHRRLGEFNDSELKNITVLQRGTPLEQGSTYIDLKADRIEEFTASKGMRAESRNWYVPKSEVDYQLWNRLIGVDNPERTGQADDS